MFTFLASLVTLIVIIILFLIIWAWNRKRDYNDPIGIMIMVLLAVFGLSFIITTCATGSNYFVSLDKVKIIIKGC